jgi:branched-chain amino acid transport system ATP-binding protein
VLSLSNLRAAYGQVEVLKGISLEVAPGEIVTVIGANGAGKTTTLLCISGIHKLRAGEVRFEGNDISRRPAHEIARMGIRQSPEGRKIFPRLTVLENLEMGAFGRTDHAAIHADQEKCFTLFPILKDRRTQPGGTLSGGEQQMLAIARALMGRPKLLLLDEPSLGLAPMIVTKIFEVIRELNREGIAILLVEQNARLALKLANRGYVMETGTITLTDSAAALLANPRVKEAYLGD